MLLRNIQYPTSNRIRRDWKNNKTCSKQSRKQQLRQINPSSKWSSNSRCQLQLINFLQCHCVFSYPRLTCGVSPSLLSAKYTRIDQHALLKYIVGSSMNIQENPTTFKPQNFKYKYVSCRFPKYFVGFGKYSNMPVAKVVLLTLLGNEAV